ncbi:MAG TPA: phosphoglycerate mutase (2,3-diphosphoglycerate-independent), partial [Thermoanaerobacterales bacterium]|nr:phosphoglycerate mutase (2,3-diphosphoglycerate-independent) [Thermoanaerobacterales bacterium]
KDGNPVATVEDGDSIIFFNFRPDRARQLTYALVDEEFDGFERTPPKTFFVCMTQYDEKLTDVKVAYEPLSLDNIFAKVLAENNLRQLRIAETEKYAHVTFFFNGGVEKSYPGEDRVLIPSPKVATYDLKPEMSAYEVCERVLEKIEEDIYDVIILNFANPDMVGHTGVYEAAVKAIETVDECMGRIYRAILDKGGILFITADHGNAEQMFNAENNGAHTAHTTNPVPFILVSDTRYELSPGILADIAPTMLDLLKIEKPEEMTGKSLIQ